MGKTKLAKSTSPIQYIHIAISVLFMFGFGYLPPFSTVTPLGMKLLGIFIAICTVGIIVVGYFFNAIQNTII